MNLEFMRRVYPLKIALRSPGNPRNLQVRKDAAHLIFDAVAELLGSMLVDVGGNELNGFHHPLFFRLDFLALYFFLLLNAVGGHSIYHIR